MIVETLIERARAAPDRTAILCDGEPLSYGWFVGRIAARRRELAFHGLRPGGVAIVCLDLLDNWIVSLALRSLGLTTLALPSLESLAGLGPLDVECVVAATDLGPAAERLKPILIRPADGPEGADVCDLETAPAAASGGHILLTSGTTGRYKKVLVSRHVDAANIPLYVEIAGLTEQSAVLLNNFGLWTSAGYNVAAGVWRAGGCVVLERGADWPQALFSRPITDAWLTPYALAQHLAAPADIVRRRDDLRLVVGGFAMPWSMAEQTLEKVSRRLFSLVASTEVGPWSLGPVERPDDLIWHPIHPSRHVEVVDESGAPSPAGRLGRVRVRTVNGLAGYLADDEASRAVFQNGWFYPGDLGVLGPDGRLALYGRASDVIPVHGAKVAAAPYEQALRERLGADEVCVFSAQNDQAEEELHVAVETRRPISLDELTTAAKAVLEGFPRVHFHRVDALPRNAMGKIQRFALKETLLPGRLHP